MGDVEFKASETQFWSPQTRLSISSSFLVHSLTVPVSASVLSPTSVTSSNAMSLSNSASGTDTNSKVRGLYVLQQLYLVLKISSALSENIHASVLSAFCHFHQLHDELEGLSATVAKLKQQLADAEARAVSAEAARAGLESKLAAKDQNTKWVVRESRSQQRSTSLSTCFLCAIAIIRQFGSGKGHQRGQQTTGYAASGVGGEE